MVESEMVEKKGKEPKNKERSRQNKHNRMSPKKSRCHYVLQWYFENGVVVLRQRETTERESHHRIIKKKRGNKGEIKPVQGPNFYRIESPSRYFSLQLSILL